MADIADAWEVYSQREIERMEARRKYARCGNCAFFHAIPQQHGDYAYGYCDVLGEWCYGGDKVADTDCEDWRE